MGKSARGENVSILIGLTAALALASLGVGPKVQLIDALIESRHHLDPFHNLLVHLSPHYDTCFFDRFN